MKTNQSSKWIVDVALFAGFIVAFFLDFTGLELHQWIGVAAVLLAAYHLLAHWNWVSAISRRINEKTVGKARLYYLIDAAIGAGFFTTTVSGLVISTWFDLAAGSSGAWREIHILASIATLLVTILKIGLHWRWIVSVAKRLFSAPPAPRLKPVPVVQAAGARQMSRREFLVGMGVVGAASILALSKAIDGLQLPEAEASGESLQTEASSLSTSDQAGVNPSCSLQCGRGCSYPGHCRRYADRDGNNRCDYGECA